MPTEVNGDRKRFLVTGGAGFLGSHLVDLLLRRGHAVICLDDMSTGVHQNIQEPMDDGSFQLIEGAVEENISLDVDGIFNLACPASPVQYQRNPIKTFKTCVLGTMNMLDLARACDCPMVQASTSEVYGDPLVHPQPEEYWGNVNPIGPRSCYDEGKRAAETLCSDYQSQYGTRAKIVRIFNTYGPRMALSDGRVVSNFVVQALRNEPITLFGSGTQTRSFCFVDDLVLGLERMMETDTGDFGPVNLGNPNEHTIAELAQTIVRLTGSASKIINKALPIDDPKRRKPDIQRAQHLLGWHPEIELADGLTRTIAYFQDKLNG